MICIPEPFILHERLCLYFSDTNSLTHDQKPNTSLLSMVVCSPQTRVLVQVLSEYQRFHKK